MSGRKNKITNIFFAPNGRGSRKKPNRNFNRDLFMHKLVISDQLWLAYNRTSYESTPLLQIYFYLVVQQYEFVVDSHRLGTVTHLSSASAGIATIL